MCRPLADRITDLVRNVLDRCLRSGCGYDFCWSFGNLFRVDSRMVFRPVFRLPKAGDFRTIFKVYSNVGYGSVFNRGSICFEARLSYLLVALSN